MEGLSPWAKIHWRGESGLRWSSPGHWRNGDLPSISPNPTVRIIILGINPACNGSSTTPWSTANTPTGTGTAGGTPTITAAAEAAKNTGLTAAIVDEVAHRDSSERGTTAEATTTRSGKDDLMTIQRRNRTRRLQLEPLEARDVPSVVSPHAGLLRPMARAEVHKAVHHQVQAARVHAPAALATSNTASAGAASSSTPPAGSSPEPITVVLGPVMTDFVLTEVQVQVFPLMRAPAPVPDGSISST